MITSLVRSGAVAALTLLSTPAWAQAETADTALRAAIASPQRNPEFIKRDPVRHPMKELEFFGLEPTQTVVEIWPGGGYWTQILAPDLHAHGTYYIALPPSKPGADARDTPFMAKLAAMPTVYGKVIPSEAGQGRYDIAPAGSVDLVLTFRNLHNWMADGYAPEMLTAFYQALKPGGGLGIEEHRGNRKTVQDPKAEDGYVREDYAIAMIRKAGFELVGSSEMDANPKDTANWPGGVWTLPPTLTLGAKDRDKYLAIGEADNFVLKFRKP
jgi:predicted methyltransferase